MKVEIEAITKGFEEATEKVEALAEAYDSFPAQVTVRGCKDCTINMYPSQTKIIEIGANEEDEKQPEDHWNEMVPPEEDTIITNPNGAVIMSFGTYAKLKGDWQLKGGKPQGASDED